MKNFKMFKVLSLLFTLSVLFVSCKKEKGKDASLGSPKSETSRSVVIYSNADDEAVAGMKKALSDAGYGENYIFQSFGTSELGGKLLAEGADIEADLVTMSTFYLDSTNETYIEKTHTPMFLDLSFGKNCLITHSSFTLPLLAIQGALIVNTKMLEDESLERPVSIRDLSNEIYHGNISVVDIQGSTTAWLMIQALLESYGESGTRDALKLIYKNAGPHLELSGSGPIKKVRAGEVALGFGLRHQALRDKKKGLPIDYVDPAEGNYILTESVAVINKGEKTNALGMTLAKVIIEKARTEIIRDYPVALYEGEVVDEASDASETKTFAEPLSVSLLQKHIELSESSK